MTKEELEIDEIVNLETKAWDMQDGETLISIFHKDMVWPWPKTPESHDPMEWIMILGGYDKKRGMKN